MTLDKAKFRIRTGVRFGEVFPLLETQADRDSLKEWYVTTPGIPSMTEPATVSKNGNITTGNVCPTCQGTNLVRTGSCVTCQDCGHNEGCG